MIACLVILLITTVSHMFTLVPAARRHHTHSVDHYLDSPQHKHDELSPVSCWSWLYYLLHKRHHLLLLFHRSRLYLSILSHKRHARFTVNTGIISLLPGYRHHHLPSVPRLPWTYHLFTTQTNTLTPHKTQWQKPSPSPRLQTSSPTPSPTTAHPRSPLQNSSPPLILLVMTVSLTHHTNIITPPHPDTNVILYVPSSAQLIMDHSYWDRSRRVTRSRASLFPRRRSAGLLTAS